MFNAVESGSIEAVDILLTNGAGTDVVSEVSFMLKHAFEYHRVAQFLRAVNFIDLNINENKTRKNLIHKK